MARAAAGADRPQAGAIRVTAADDSFTAPVDGTDLDPIYQTVRYDVNAYDLALPNGKYRVTLQSTNRSTTPPQARLRRGHPSPQGRGPARYL